MLRMAPAIRESSTQSAQLRLTRKEADLLTLLRKNDGHCLSRDYLLRTVWGYEVGVRTRTLDVHVQRLRAKLRVAGIPGEIQTILGHGYCWRALNGSTETLSVA